MSDLEFASGRYTKIASYKINDVEADSEEEATNLVRNYIINEENVTFGGNVDVMCEKSLFGRYDCIGVVTQSHMMFLRKE